MKRRKSRVVAGTLALALMLGACGSSGGDPGGGGADHEAMGHEGGDASSSASFGEPGHSGHANRTVEVTALDSLEFEPSQLKVKQGDTVTFKITNDGRTAHEFVLGHLEYQEEHAKEMAAGADHSMSDENAVELDPGATGEVTWTFTEPGEVLFACHVEGHYKGGMFGTIEVVES